MALPKNDPDSATQIEAVLFDTDGVITDTAAVHMAVWKQLFDAYLRMRGGQTEPFSAEDYRRYVNGKPRYDGVQAFLASRGIDLPLGELDDEPEAETICGLGNRKNEYFRKWLAENSVRAFPGSRAFMSELDAAGICAAVFSSSRNARYVLDAAGVLDRFEAKVDGQDMASAGLPGKPDPAIMLRTADQLGTVPTRAAVVEDAISGVEAGVAGGFAQVVGVDRDGDGDALMEAGADFVVADLAELAVGEDRRLVARSLRSTPHVEEARDAILRRMKGKKLAVFLDYDGTLTPIVEDPAAATLSDSMRAALSGLAALIPVAIVSGRDLRDVKGFLQDDTLYYAGSHGFDLAGPGGWHEVVEKGKKFLPTLEAVAEKLEARLASIDGARVERKRFSLAVHFRRVAEGDEAAVARIVRETVAEHEDVRASGGKKVFDIKPRVDWHKGYAVLSLLKKLDFDGDDVLPIYIGDDTTDEDAFRSLSDCGLGIVVRDGEDRRTSARYALDGIYDVERLLSWLTEAISEEVTQ
ncbi:putative glycosyl hydrolase/MT2062 [Jannaschia seosinensis]|uniref:Trehalose 6-phosphate phosphatase n=1 Tax=Jannaschia seosinensis TaxID=313367 RepID=A0A0M7BE92_9RHOB|nr:trehalose-phosphatase [Jannaschia seosinensis]CUH40509.1 putative glycosyl hydrolase/MT2062 [Jannaschia seosinensis]